LFPIYAYGMEMPGRKWIHSDYRYGFNDKENDRETVSSGQGTQDYGMRIYNPALGRFLSLDPVAARNPMMTPYSFASNTPIQAIDLDGLETYHYMRVKAAKTGKTSLVLYNVERVYKTIQTGWVYNNKSVWGRYPVYKTVEDKTKRYVVHQTDKTYHQKGTKNWAEYYDENVEFSSYDAASKATDEDFVGTAQDHYQSFKQGMINVSEESHSQGGAGGMMGVFGPAAAIEEAIVARGVSGTGFTASGIQKLLTASSDDMITLYRGMTGSEGGGGALFLAEEGAYAASYSKNVQSFTISRSGFNYLKGEGLIETKMGINASTGAQGTELMIGNETIKKAILGGN
jgi:RHS repeat-associated protein